MTTAQEEFDKLEKEKSWAVQRLVEKTIEQKLERTDLEAQLAAVTTERDELRRDAKRLDLMAQQLFEHKWNGVIDSGSRTHWSLVGPYRHVVAKMEGKTFRKAIDTALQPERRIEEGK